MNDDAPVAVAHAFIAEMGGRVSFYGDADAAAFLADATRA